MNLLNLYGIPKTLRTQDTIPYLVLSSAIIISGLVVWMVTYSHVGIALTVTGFVASFFYVAAQYADYKSARHLQSHRPSFVDSVEEDGLGWVIGFFIGEEEIVWGYENGTWYWKHREGTATCWQDAAAQVQEMMHEEVPYALVPTIGMVVIMANGRAICWEEDVQGGITDLRHYFPEQMAWVNGTGMQYAEVGDELINRNAIVSVLKKFSNRTQKEKEEA